MLAGLGTITMPLFRTQVDVNRTHNSITGSAGIIVASNYVTQASATTVDVAGGDGFFRVSNSAQARLVVATWPASLGLSCPLNSIRYVGIDYNSGSPTAFVTATFSDFNWYTKFPLAKVYNNGTKMHVVNANAHSEDTPNLTRQMLRQCFPFQSTKTPEGGGLALSSPTGRYIAVTAGSAWHGFNRYSMPAFDSQTSQRFEAYYRNGSGGFTQVTNVQIWPNTQYDNGSGTLATMTNNRYAVLWFYEDVEDGDVKMIYGRGEYVTFALAEAEAPPNTYPLGLNEHSVLLGRIIFQKSAASGTVQSAITNLFQTQGITVHNELSGLQGGAASEYYHLTGAQYTLATQIGTSTQTGLISSTDWNTFNNKEPNISAGTTAQYWRGDKSWQTLDKIAVGLGNVENTALSTWAGSTNLTTLGTVSTGTWGATAIGVTKGGTGLTGITASRLLWSTASNTLGEIALGYGMQVASSELRTPQDLQTTSSPQFTRLGVGMAADGTRAFSVTGGGYFSGNVGIGTTTPGTKLSFGSSVANAPLSFSIYEPNAAGIGMDSATAGLRLSGDPSGGSQPVVDMGYYYGTSPTHDNWRSKMIVLSSGNVGIGTTSPSEKLDVNGNIKTASPSGGTAKPWKLGGYTSGAATQAGKVRVEIDGVAYDLLTA